MSEQHEFSMSMDGDLLPCQFCKQTHEPPPAVMQKLMEAREWEKHPLETPRLDEMTQRHVDAQRWVLSLAGELTQAKLQLTIDAVQAALADIPRLIVEVRRAQREAETLPAEIAKAGL